MADNDGDSDEARTLGPLQAAECTYRIAFGPRAGQKVLTALGAMPREKDLKQTPCADIDGFSLRAAVRCGADDRHALEQLCRYITRPVLANERVQTNAAGQVVLKLKTAWRNETTHLVMSPLEFMQRRAALVPRPQRRATGIGCARGFSGPVDLGQWQWITRGRRPRRTISADAVEAQPSCATFNGRRGGVEGRVRGAIGKESV